VLPNSTMTMARMIKMSGPMISPMTSMFPMAGSVGRASGRQRAS
jgi:hypothetical protein